MMHYINPSLFISASRTFVKFNSVGIIAGLTVKISVGFKNLSTKCRKVEELTAFQCQFEMFFTSGKITAIEITSRHIEMRGCISWHRSCHFFPLKHSFQPAQSFSEVAAYHQRQPKIVSNDAHILTITLLFR